VKYKSDLNKNDNIKEIADEINIMDDSIVFIDDNPAERNLVREGLPNVSVPELNEPEKYVDIIDKSGFFEVTNLSEDDKKRNEYYRNDKKRQESKKSFENYDEYLKSLNMSCELSEFNGKNIERVVQLINKTNQFNLTTVRMTKNEVANCIENDNTITICATLNDKFGANGIVSCLIASKKDNTMIIDLWVMSCRVFKRELEKAIFDRLAQECINNGISKIVGKYYRTKKNNYVENLYEALGFDIIEKDEEHSIWEFKISKDYQKQNKLIEVTIND
jgi:FkbH-like protein